MEINEHPWTSIEKQWNIIEIHGQSLDIHGHPRISIGPLISTDTNGHPWIFEKYNGYQRIGVYRYLPGGGCETEIFDCALDSQFLQGSSSHLDQKRRELFRGIKEIHRHPRMSEDMHIIHCYMDNHGYPQVSMDIHGHP